MDTGRPATSSRSGSGPRTGARPGGGRPGGRPGGGRPGGRPGGGSRPGGRKRTFIRKRVCRFCADRATAIDYKNRDLLVRFLTEKGKIIPRRTTGTCASCQRMLAETIKRARHAGIIPFLAAV